MYVSRDHEVLENVELPSRAMMKISEKSVINVIIALAFARIISKHQLHFAEINYRQNVFKNSLIATVLYVETDTVVFSHNLPQIVERFHIGVFHQHENVYVRVSL